MLSVDASTAPVENQTDADHVPPTNLPSAPLTTGKTNLQLAQHRARTLATPDARDYQSVAALLALPIRRTTAKATRAAPDLDP